MLPIKEKDIPCKLKGAHDVANHKQQNKGPALTKSSTSSPGPQEAPVAAGFSLKKSPQVLGTKLYYKANSKAKE